MNSSSDGLSGIAQELCLRESGISVVPDPEATLLIEAFADVHGIDPAQHYWWEALNVGRCLSYGSSIEDWRTLVSGLLGAMGEGVFLVVTDDEPRPWPVLRIGDGSVIAGVLSEMHFFEYFVLSADCLRFFFDTHHNQLIAYP